MEESYIKRIQAIIDRNMTPSGPNFDAEALLWALGEIKKLQIPKGPILSTSSTEVDYL